MARPCRIQFPHACQLVTLRGMEGLGVFSQADDVEAFVQLLRQGVIKHRVRLHAHAAAGNRALLLLETPEANASAFMQGLQTAYARRLRDSRGLKGSCFQGRYLAKILQKEKYLTQAAAWVHTLPLRELTASRRRAETLLNHPGSSFPATQDPGFSCAADVTEILRAYGSPAAKRGERHLRDCLHLWENPAGWLELMETSPLAIGDEDFLKEVSRRHQAVRSGRGGCGLRIYGRRRSGVARTRILDAVAAEWDADKSEFFRQGHGSLLRPALAFALYRFGALTQREIADYIRVGSSAAVSLQIRRFVRALEQDPALQRSVQRLTQQLSGSTKSQP